MFGLNSSQLDTLTALRSTLPGQWRPSKHEPINQAERDRKRRELSFHESLKKGRGFREAQTTAQHLKRDMGHAARAALPITPFHWVHEPRVRHCAYGKAAS